MLSSFSVFMESLQCSGYWGSPREQKEPRGRAGGATVQLVNRLTGATPEKKACLAYCLKRVWSFTVERAGQQEWLPPNLQGHGVAISHMVGS